MEPEETKNELNNEYDPKKLNLVQPKIDTNRKRKKTSKHKQERILNEWQLNRVKGQEEWKKEEWKKKNDKPKKGKKVKASKYKKYKVTFLENKSLELRPFENI